ncbi:MAG TPA: ubiquitin-like domain-containing protein [Actinomycetota bacterium]|nr:ubiquitin-like domain-containing protein [Actinomycetota bacterium]
MPVRPSRVRRLRARKAMGNALLASVVLVGGLTYVAIQKTVTLVVDQGRPEAVRTMSASVGELLDAQGILVGYGDLVTPPTQTSLADGMTVFVERGWLDGITAPGPDDVGVWVMEGATAPHLMLASRSGEDWFSAGDPAGWSQRVSANVVVKGKDHDVLTNADTVRELLSAMGITPDRDDRVLPSPRTPLIEGMHVRYDAIAFRTRDVRVPIPYTTSTRYSDTLSPGAIRVERAGVDGLMVERTRIKFVNGKAVATVVLSRTVVQEAIAALRVAGRDSGTQGTTQLGEASWYSFAPGGGLTAAHPWLPFGTVVTVTNIANGKTVQVVINDRGPFGGRIIDLSGGAFARIASLSQGVCQVRLSW